MFNLFKQSVSRINDKEPIIAVLTTIYEILRDNGFNAQSFIIKDLIACLYQDNTAGFLKALKNNGIWGGMGSVTDSWFQDENNNRDFQKAFVDLAVILREQGIIIKQLDETASLYQEMCKRN